jgi:hypothetical protein
MIASNHDTVTSRSKSMQPTVELKIIADIFEMPRLMEVLAKEVKAKVMGHNPQMELPNGEGKQMPAALSAEEAPKKKAGRPKKLKASPAVVDADEPIPSDDEEEETSTIDVASMKSDPVANEDSVRNALKALISSDATAGPKKAQELLASFGAKKFSELDPKRYGAVLASINAAL